MEDLTKTQLVLLTLLVSFVTSIATGIITVSLLEEASTEITQTINRVVERTIERVVPDEEGSDSSGSEGTVVREVTVVVNEEDRVIDAIEKNVKSVVRITYNPGDGTGSPFYGIGTVVTSNGLLVTARRSVFSPTYTYRATLPDGLTYDLRLREDDQTNSLVFFEIIKPNQEALPITAPTFTTSEVSLGQTVIVIEGQERNSISTGRVASLIRSGTEENTSTTGIEADMLFKTTVQGGPLLNLTGDVVGIRVPREQGSIFVPSQIIRSKSSQLET